MSTIISLAIFGVLVGLFRENLSASLGIEDQVVDFTGEIPPEGPAAVPLAENRCECEGTSNGFSYSTRDRYHDYRCRYANCTHVNGNLELVFLGDPSQDLSFLSSIREVSGYVLIVSVYNDFVPLTNLRVIRGDTLFALQNAQYSLFMSLNYQPRTNASVGLKELRFTSLQDISRGDVYIKSNRQLCFEDTINWKHIVSDNEANIYLDEDQSEGRTCANCDPTCEDDNGERHCWGERPNMCQNVV